MAAATVGIDLAKNVFAVHEDHLRGLRYPLELIYADPTVHKLGRR
jgi:hypothetical protein